MAGIDKDIEGEAMPMPNLKIGYLPQEPQLDPEQTVREAVEQGIGGVLDAKKRLDEVYAAYAEPDADFDKLAAEQAELEAIIAAAGSENTDLQLEIAADALRLPPWDAKIGVLSGGEKRRVALCRLLLSASPTCCCSTSRPTTWTPSRSSGWSMFLQRFPGTVVAITHDRYFLDNAAEWILELDRGRGIPYKGNYSDLAGPEGEAPRARAEDRGRAHQGDEEGAGVGAPEPEGPPGQEQGAPGALRGTVATSTTRSATRPTRSSSRWPSAWATR